MCGRYAITLPPEAVRAYFAYGETPNFPPRYNIAPTQPIPIVVAEPHSGGARRHFLLVRWGFLPGFVKDPKGFPLIINARAETLAREAELSRRAQAPPLPRDRRRLLRMASATPAAAGRRRRRPYLVRRVGGEPMGFAGLYETWSDPSGGEIDTACIVTTAANRAGRRACTTACRRSSRRDAFAPGSTSTASTPPTALALLSPRPSRRSNWSRSARRSTGSPTTNAGVQAPVAEPIRAASEATLF